MKQEEEREELERRQKKRREATTVRLASHGLSILNIARHFLKEQERAEKAVLRNSHLRQEKKRSDPGVSSSGSASAVRVSAISGVFANGSLLEWK